MPGPLDYSTDIVACQYDIRILKFILRNSEIHISFIIKSAVIKQYDRTKILHLLLRQIIFCSFYHISTATGQITLPPKHIHLFHRKRLIDTTVKSNIPDATVIKLRVKRTYSISRNSCLELEITGVVNDVTIGSLLAAQVSDLVTGILVHTTHREGLHASPSFFRIPYQIITFSLCNIISEMI